MSLVVSNEGDVLSLKFILNKSTPGDVKLRLYTNNHTPAKTDAYATYTESTATGYSTKTLTGASWSVSTGGGNVTTGSYAAQTWSFGASDTIYGYYVSDNGGTTLLWAELFSNGPYNVVNGSTVTVTPTLVAN